MGSELRLDHCSEDVQRASTMLQTPTSWTRRNLMPCAHQVRQMHRSPSTQSKWPATQISLLQTLLPQHTSAFLGLRIAGIRHNKTAPKLYKPISLVLNATVPTRAQSQKSFSTAQLDNTQLTCPLPRTDGARKWRQMATGQGSIVFYCKRVYSFYCSGPKSPRLGF